MRVMQLEAPGTALALRARDKPVAGTHELLIKVRACGVCRTDLHVVEWRAARAEAGSRTRS